MFLLLDIERWPLYSRGSRRVLLLAHCEREALLKSSAKWFSTLVPHQSNFFSFLPVFDDFCSDDNVAVRDDSSISSLASIRSHKQYPRRLQKGLSPFDWSKEKPERQRPVDVPSEIKTLPVAKWSCSRLSWDLNMKVPATSLSLTPLFSVIQHESERSKLIHNSQQVIEFQKDSEKKHSKRFRTVSMMMIQGIQMIYNDAGLLRVPQNDSKSFWKCIIITQNDSNKFCKRFSVLHIIILSDFQMIYSDPEWFRHWWMFAQLHVQHTYQG